MKIKSLHLFEDESSFDVGNIDDLKKIATMCKPFIINNADNFANNRYMYRGVVGSGFGFSDISPIKSPVNRTPLDSNALLHSILDSKLTVYGGINWRKNAVFAATKRTIASNYGNVAIFLPIGEYEMLTSDTIKDAIDLNHIFGARNVALMTKGDSAVVNDSKLKMLLRQAYSYFQKIVDTLNQIIDHEDGLEFRMAFDINDLSDVIEQRRILQRLEMFRFKNSSKNSMNTDNDSDNVVLRYDPTEYSTEFINIFDLDFISVYHNGVVLDMLKNADRIKISKQHKSIMISQSKRILDDDDLKKTVLKIYERLIELATEDQYTMTKTFNTDHNGEYMVKCDEYFAINFKQVNHTYENFGEVLLKLAKNEDQL